MQDYIGAFALTAGVGLKEFTERLREEGDEYNAIMAKLLADRLTEAFAESVHEFIRRVAWGYQTVDVADTEGITVGVTEAVADGTAASAITTEVADTESVEAGIAEGVVNGDGGEMGAGNVAQQRDKQSVKPVTIAPQEAIRTIARKTRINRIRNLLYVAYNVLYSISLLRPDPS